MKKTVISVLVLISVFNLHAQITDEPINLLTKTGELRGTLLVPEFAKKFNLIILQPGSGPTDRNGNNPLGVKAKSYRLLAEALVQKKIAVLLIDKRGVGASASAGRAEQEMLFEDYVNDLADWAAMMKKDKRIKKMIIAGHSEGSLVGMITTQKINVRSVIINASCSFAGDFFWFFFGEAKKNIQKP